jgi:hypothetical protein
MCHRSVIVLVAFGAFTLMCLSVLSDCLLVTHTIKNYMTEFMKRELNMEMCHSSRFMNETAKNL